MTSRILVLVAMLTLVWPNRPASADDPDKPVDYLRDVKPILARHCVACHGTLRQQAGLRLDSSRLWRKGSEQGTVIVPGNPKKSRLVDAIFGRNDQTKMPPDDATAPLSTAERNTLVRWIIQGAKAPDEVIPPDPRLHWAFQPPKPLAGLKTDNAIDDYFSGVHAREQLEPLQPADRATLLRRASLDLVGLPPTREQLKSFLADTDPAAYNKLVDRLLESPHHGERWARHWMDIWRYTDWFGLGKEVRYSQKHIWRWREWIVNSLNRDSGYDHMLIDMLAADELAPTDTHRLPATGFLVRNWYLFNRNFWLDDIVQHTGKAFLGLTLNCSRCHDHKYDPLSQAEYYQFRAFFEPHDIRMDPVPGQADPALDGLPRAFDKTLDAKTFLFVRGDEKAPDKSRSLPALTPAVLPDLPSDISPVKLPLAAWYPALRETIVRERTEALQQQLQQQQAQLATDQATLVQHEKRLKDFRDKKTTQKKTVSRFLKETFSKPRPKQWERVNGTWTFQDHFLRHVNLEGGQARLELRRTPPRDFIATLKFRILDGRTRSIGMAFDMVPGHRIGVYMSPSGSKVQVYLLRNGKETYPTQAHHSQEVKNDHIYELTFAVKDRWLNAWVDGQFRFAYQLPDPRREGRFSLTSYQATVDYLATSISELPPEVLLARTNQDGKDSKPPEPVVTLTALRRSVANATHFVSRQRRQVDLSRLVQEDYQARLAAELAKHRPPPTENKQLSLRAAAAERQLARHRAEDTVTQATTGLAQARLLTKDKAKKIAAAEKTLKTAEQILSKARKNVEDAQATSYTSLGPTFPQASSGRRLALARWIADKKNPLTARVAVNHIWTRHFGQSLVGSDFDFGLRTSAPRHQRLLDHLAVDFMAHGWSMKRLHRLIVTSAAYRRRSSPSKTAGPLQASDPDNQDYWRMNTRRMEGEILRDSLLLLSGKLDSTVGGRNLNHDLANAGTSKTGFRRTIYYRYARPAKIEILKIFDPASVEECYRRHDTIVPQQALALRNSKLAVDRSNDIASLISGEIGKKQDPVAFVDAAFETVLGRKPTASERQQTLTALKQLTAVAGDTARGHLVHVLVMHNDFIMIR